jgi:hypothetical protein
MTAASVLTEVPRVPRESSVKFPQVLSVTTAVAVSV